MGAPGSNYTNAEWINDTDQVVGFWSEDGPFVGPFHSVLWDHGQTITLGTIGGDDNSNAFDINAQGRVVGQTWHFNGVTTDSSHAFVWQKGQGIVDLNTVLTNETDLFLTEANFITDTGIIVAFGVNPNGDVRAAVLTPETDLNASVARHNLSLSPKPVSLLQIGDISNHHQD